MPGIVLAALLLIIAGCGSGSRLPVAPGGSGLPPLPLLSSAPDFAPVRTAAMELNLSIPGASFVEGLKSDEATIVETSLLLTATGGELAQRARRAIGGDGVRAGAQRAERGLVLAQEIVEQHMGRLWADRRDTRGTSLQVLLPVWSGG